MAHIEGSGLQSGVFDAFLNMQSADLTAHIGDFGIPIESEETVQESVENVQGSLPHFSKKIHTEPYVEIIEEPRQRGLRFRYQCEGRSAGSIPGQNSTAEKKTYPTIKIHNHTGPAIIVVSCVSKDSPYKPHPHALVGKDCKKGVCTVKVKDTSIVSFPHLGIQCAKKKGIQESLDLRKLINVDPFQSGFDFPNTTSEMSAVRLCFQVFLPDCNGKITKVLDPVVSQPIHDKKALNDLVICRVDRSSGKAQGGDEVFLLCEKINKDDIGVRFYEEGRDGSVVWENYGEFGVGDVHRQFAIVFRTPQYQERYISRPVDVNMQLQRTSDGDTSDPITFTYMPEDPDPDRIEEKRKRKAERMINLEHDISTGVRCSGANIDVKEGLRSKLKANRKYTSSETKSENVALPTYTLSNISSSFTDQCTMQYSSADNSSLGNVTTTSIPNNMDMLTHRTDYNLIRSHPATEDVSINTAFFDTTNIDPQVLVEYFHDNGLQGEDFLSFDPVVTTENSASAFQEIGANEIANGQNNIDQDAFLNAEEALNRLQK